MSSSTGPKILQLKSSDDEIYRVEEAVAKQSGLIRKFLEVVGEENAPIPLPNVSGRMLRMAMEWSTKNADEKLAKEELEEWESKFMEVDMDVMFELILAANNLELTDLLNRLCKKVAGIMAGKTPEELRKIFKIENDFSPEEEAELMKRF